MVGAADSFRRQRLHRQYVGMSASRPGFVGLLMVGLGGDGVLGRIGSVPTGGDGEVRAYAANDDRLAWSLRLAHVDPDGVRPAAVPAFDVRLDTVTSAIVVDVILPGELGQGSF